MSGQPGRQRNHDDVRDDVARNDQGPLVARRADVALNIRQRDVYDRRVDDLEHRSQDHRNGDGNTPPAVFDNIGGAS
jgi:hypothetical protein